MYNYYAATVWAVNIVLIVIVALTCAAIFSCVLFSELHWQKRRRALLNLKNNVYEMVLASKETPEGVCLPSISDITPQQYIDIETNRTIDAAFFNDAEKKLFSACFIKPDNINKLVGIVEKSANKWKRIEALLCLGYAQAESAIGIFKKLIFSRDNDIVYFSIVALGQIKTAQSARILLDFLRKEPASGYKIAAILESFPEEISGDISKLINYHDPLVRLWALKLLSKFMKSEQIKNVEKLTNDQSAEVRAAACDCLGNINSAETGATLIACLKNDSWLVRSHAVLALSKTMKDAAMPMVIPLINDASWSVVDAVKEAMTKNIKASLPYIKRFLEGKDEVPKKYSVFALQNSGYLAELLNDAISGKAKDTETQLLKGVVRSGIHAGLDSILNNLDPATRAKALEVLMNMEGA